MLVVLKVRGICAQAHAGTKWDNSSIQWIAIEVKETIPFENTVDRSGRSLPDRKNDPLLRSCLAKGRHWVHEGCGMPR